MAASRSHLEASTSLPMSNAVRVMTERSSCGRGSVVLDQAPEQSHDACSSRGAGRGRGGGAAKNKAARILDDSKRGACGDISSHMKRSFVEQQYSSSTGMDKKE
jgi:hypothetical protein